jgi:hypothetical protein
MRRRMSWVMGLGCWRYDLTVVLTVWDHASG